MSQNLAASIRQPSDSKIQIEVKEIHPVMVSTSGTSRVNNDADGGDFSNE